jgi:spermidine dehydrogenase
VTYARNGALEQVTGANVIFACWHASIPYIAADLPAEQKAALGESFKLPEIVAQVLIRNWEAFTRVGMKQAFMPGSKKWHYLWLVYPVEDIGSYKFPSDPKDPILVTLWGNPSADEPAATPREAAAAARGRMFGTTFAEYELWIREALAGTVGKGGFDPANDIEAITINRWPHGYAYEYLRPNDPFWPEGPTPAEIGSRPFGRYTFANSDRAPRAYMHIAIEEAHRAVQELNQQSPSKDRWLNQHT